MGRLAERSNNKTEDIANAIIQHVSDLNRNATTKFEETLKKLETAIEENLKTIVDQTRVNREELETRSKENEEHISEEAAKNFNDLLGGIQARLSQHERMLNTHVAVCAEQYNNIAHGKVVYQLPLLNGKPSPTLWRLLRSRLRRPMPSLSPKLLLLTTSQSTLSSLR